jgi:hypothetical protein
MHLRILFLVAVALLFTMGSAFFARPSSFGRYQHIRSLNYTYPKDISKMLFPGDPQSVTYAGLANWTISGPFQNESQVNIAVTGRFDVDVHHKKLTEIQHELDIVQVDGGTLAQETWNTFTALSKSVFQYESYLQQLHNFSDPNFRCFYFLGNSSQQSPNTNFSTTGFVQGKDVKIGGVNLNVFTLVSSSSDMSGFSSYFMERYYLHKGTIVIFEKNQTQISPTSNGGPQREETFGRVKVTKASKLHSSYLNVSAPCAAAKNPIPSPTN